MVSFFSDPFFSFLDLNFYWSVIVFLDFVHNPWYPFEGILMKIETFLDLFLGFLFDFLVWFLFLFMFLMKLVSLLVFPLSDQCFMWSFMGLCRVFVCGWILFDLFGMRFDFFLLFNFWIRIVYVEMNFSVTCVLICDCE